MRVWIWRSIFNRELAFSSMVGVIFGDVCASIGVGGEGHF